LRLRRKEGTQFAKMKTFKISILLAFIVLISIAVIFFIRYDIKDILYSSKPVEPVKIEESTETDQISDSLKIRRLEIDNIYWKNRIEMAKDESIDLLIDLVSPELSLEIKGVLVYSAPVKNYIMSSQLISDLANPIFKEWLNSPRLLENEWGSVAKEPIQIRAIGPRSEGENILTHFRDSEAEKESHIILKYSGRLTIILRQLELVADSLKAVNVPMVDNPYVLEIFLSKTSVNTIYRALETGTSQLALRPE
jgi:hypothetical protein